jgi:DNA (cytosine-5)-methyltransferase 1
MLNGLDLFSGIGGLTIALAPWVQPIAYCENDRYASAVLLSRMASGDIPAAPIWDDVRTLTRDMFPSEIDIIYGGFPCQDVSSAGLRKGLEGERTGLFREAIRLVRECKPKFVFLENVQGIKKFVHTVRGELEALGYDCRDGLLSAAEVGAAHKRNRWWLLAYSNKHRQPELHASQHELGAERKAPSNSINDGSQESLAYAARNRREQGNTNPTGSRAGIGENERVGRSFLSSWWNAEPDVGRVVNGVSARAHRLRGLGNAVVPLQAREAFKRLMGL